jgi:pyocin large subunit-like protein
MIPLRLSTITLIRSSIRKALSRRITTLSSAMEKHVIIATDTMLKNGQMNIIFHRMASQAVLNFSKIITSYPIWAQTEHPAKNIVVTVRHWAARHQVHDLKHGDQKIQALLH